ncbi:hypothetical protein [Calothrix sp. CCY 0018]
MSRPELGEFSSIICFKAAIAGIEERDRANCSSPQVVVKTLRKS